MGGDNGHKVVFDTEVAVVCYSLIETAELCGVQAKAYLREAARRAIRDEAVPLLHERRAEQLAASH